jgi:hypothetical protein
MKVTDKVHESSGTPVFICDVSPPRGAGPEGLENLVVLAGDALSERDCSQITAVSDFRPTELIASIAAMSGGTDYKGSRLRYATDFCIGASLDVSHGVGWEARLTQRKIQASDATHL